MAVKLKLCSVSQAGYVVRQEALRNCTILTVPNEATAHLMLAEYVRVG